MVSPLPHTNRPISQLLPAPVPAAAPRIIYHDKGSTAKVAEGHRAHKEDAEDAEKKEL